MSLHKFAEQVASQGRGDDSLLVHMTPDEVRNLQKFAEANGTTLTINPVTGLPEAGLLSDLFKAVAPLALGAFLGPGAFGIAGLGLSAGTAGLVTGGLTTLATGSLSRGLMAGLGAYGGAGLAEGLAGTGAGVLGQQASEATAMELANAGAGEGLTGEAYNKAFQQSVTDKMAGANTFSAGLNAAKADPLGFAKNNLSNIGMAAAPIMAGMMVPTTTKMPDPRDRGYIRQMAYNINPDTGKPDPLYGMREMTPIKASEFGNKTFQGQRDLFYQQNPNPYAIGTASLNQPPLQQQQQVNPMATGGIVALARGGVAHFEGGGGVNEYDYAPGGGGDGGYSVQEGGNFDYYANQFAPDEFDTGGGGGGITPEVKAAIDTAYAAGDYGAVNNLVANNNITAADVANTYKGFDTSGLAGLGINLPGVGGGSNVVTGGGGSNVVTGGGGVDFTGTGSGGITNLTGGGGGSDITFGPGDDLINAGGGGGGGGITNLAGAATTPYYFQVNPDVAAEYARNPMGLTPEQFAQAHYTNFGKKEGREFEMSAGAAYAKANNMDLVGNTLKWIDTNPFATPDQINAAITGSGMSKGDVNRTLDSLVASGKITEAERYFIQQGKGLSGMAESGAEWLKKNPNATQTEIDAVLRAAKMDTTDAQRVLSHGFQVAENQYAAALKYINDNKDVARWITSAQGQAYIKEHPEFDAKDIAFTHYERYGKKEGRKWGLDTKVVTPGGTGGVGGINTGNVTGTLLPTNPQTNAPPGTTNPYGNINNPGDLTFNNDGTITVQPNIPGRPYGGFSGMDEVKNAYTAGGGSLGYTSPVQKDPAAYYNKLTDDSLDAYNYLMGKGKNLTQRKATRGQPLAQRYDEAILGKKAVPRATTTTGNTVTVDGVKYNLTDPTNPPPADSTGTWQWDMAGKRWVKLATAAGTNIDQNAGGDGGDGGMALGGMTGYAVGGGLGTLGSYSDGGRLLKGPGDGVSDSIPATIGRKQQPARLADGEFVIPARIVSELGNGSTDAGAKKLYAMMDRVQRARGKTTGKNKVAANSRSDKYLPA